jgi:hypothetical protein
MTTDKRQQKNVDSKKMLTAKKRTSSEKKVKKYTLPFTIYVGMNNKLYCTTPEMMRAATILVLLRHAKQDICKITISVSNNGDCMVI